jgi:ubiquinone/menaquinone biosynthesis C-methylase UbiE
MPFPDEYFDFVVCRVTLPYLNIPIALREIHRVLARGGQAWFMLHGWRRTRRRWLKSITSMDLKDFVFCAYITLNSVLLLLNFQLPFMGRYESFQTDANVKVVFRRARLRIVSIERGEFFEVTVKRD